MQFKFLPVPSERRYGLLSCIFIVVMTKKEFGWQ